MLVSKDCLNLVLAKNAQTGDNFIWLSGAEAYKLNAIGVGNHIHLTLSDNRGCETVRYDHTADWANTSALKQIPVIRNVSGTGSRNFAVHSCVTADWSVAQITELITQAACEGPCITSLSTGLSTTNSAVSSLSTIVSTGLSTTNSAVASLSTAIGGGTSSLTSLSTSTSTTAVSLSTGLSAVNSAVASLSTAIDGGTSSLASLSTSTSTTAVSLSTGLSAVNSAVASLSTIVATKADLVSGTVPASQLPSFVDDVLEFPNLASFPVTGEAGKIYTDTTTNFTYRWSGTQYVRLGGDYAVTTKDEGTILTTATTEYNFTGGGVTATNSGGIVTVDVPGVVPTIPVTGTVPPTAPPASGASHWYYDSVLYESWLWNGQGWKLIQGHAIDTFGTLGQISQGSGLLIYSYVVPRNALISLSGQAFMNFVTEPTDPIYVQTNFALYRNGAPLAIQSTHADGQYGIGDGFRSSVAYAVGGFAAGDVIELRMDVSTTQLGLIVNVNATSFQAMFEG